MPSKPPALVAEHEVFWGEIAPSEHLIHVYDDERAFAALLERFVAGGLLAYESVIVIATEAHLSALNQRLLSRGFDLRTARDSDRYIELEAGKCLATFMVNGAPDPVRFTEVVTSLIARAGRHGRRVRAFGEMVAMLWQDGHTGATVQLEHLWNQVRETLPFPLFCAYPRAGFTRDMTESLKEICATHTKVISRDSREPWSTGV